MWRDLVLLHPWISGTTGAVLSQVMNFTLLWAVIIIAGYFNMTGNYCSYCPHPSKPIKSIMKCIITKKTLCQSNKWTNENSKKIRQGNGYDHDHDYEVTMIWDGPIKLEILRWFFYIAWSGSFSVKGEVLRRFSVILKTHKTFPY